MKKYLFIMMAFLLTVLVACSDDSASNDTDQNTDSEDSSESTEPKQGGNVNIPIVGDPIFNPWHPNAYAESNIVNRVLFQGLTKPGLDNLPAPSLAEDWTPSEDGLVWTFNLKEGVKWHDGVEFTADDVAFTFNDLVLNASLGSNGASNYKAVKEVVVVDPHTVEFHLDRPFASLPAYLAFNSEILPAHKFEGVENPWEYTEFNKEAPVGTGAFQFDTYTSGQSLTLKRFDDYHNGAANIETVTFKILPDVNTQIAQVLSNELDAFALEDTSSLKRLESADNLEIVTSDTTRYFWIATDLTNPLFQDVKVRQAMLHAIDRQAIIDSVLSGYGTIANSAITPDQEGYFKEDLPTYEYNVDKAKALLKEAGWEDTNGDGILDKDGKDFSFEFDIALQGDLEQMAVLVQQYLIEVGFDVKLNTLEWNAMIQKNIIERDFDMILNWWAYPTDPDVLAQYHSSNAGTGNNIPGYQNEELDALLEQGQSVGDPAERKEIYDQVQVHMAENLPYLYLWYPQALSVRSDRLQNVPDLHFGGTLHYINEWWVK
ncbi:peptide/nickel transport system substrate-binding protein [Salirhabdus euzebyi]|uniref:Peptide/nickel transport system substrate-binding protein n=1 Tax=Salirhabdus euzebyi TaxID=394506 RepID=A0A841Q5T4_9BACI|nr:ABC transporter substrate-binding protein [Salirhabdus euzebyi]MBB6453745.1 peptide/nickel transport system substrate-binding protein [Salirhabdus euzebyi]